MQEKKVLGTLGLLERSTETASMHQVWKAMISSPVLAPAPWNNHIHINTGYPTAHIDNLTMYLMRRVMLEGEERGYLLENFPAKLSVQCLPQRNL